MKIAWIFPVNQKCGISLYSHEYVKTISQYCIVEIFDLYECLSETKQSIRNLNNFDCIHIQYEASFFPKKNLLEKLCANLTKPIIITLHEVYDDFPGVYPRSHIKGKGIIRKCKEYLYDLRHPYQRMYIQHLNHSFFANKIAVHAQYHKDLLIQKGISKDLISVLPMPIKLFNDILPAAINKTKLNLSSLGFINSNYNYGLLFEVLENLTMPWHFTWIGGLRRNEDTPLLEYIKQEILKHHWHETFTITGWVPDEHRNTLLSQTDIYLALFSARSVSLSLSTALGARRFIVATDIPYTNEIVKNQHIMSIAAQDCNDVIDKINTLISDNSLQDKQLIAIDNYCKDYSFNEMAQRLVGVYKELMA